MRTCSICRSPLQHPQAIYCKRCKRLLDRVDMRRKPDKRVREAALRKAWDGTGFRCYYTGVRLIEDDYRSPRYLTFDHLPPRDESTIAVVASAINDMKSDLSDREFRRMVRQLARRFSGGTFDRRAFGLKYWKRQND
jgi:hypothetical protein